MTKLYHKEVFWKDNFDYDAKMLVYTVRRLHPHLMKHLKNPDAKHTYTLKGISKAFNLIRAENKGYLFEIEETNGIVTKAVYRVEYDNENDICLVIRKGIVKTAWINKKTDNHFTLDKSKYVCYNK